MSASERHPWWQFRAKLERWVDGDTFQATVDLGFRHYGQLRFRLVGAQGQGFNTPEVRGQERPQGLEAADAARMLVPERTEVVLRTWPAPGKFGRWLAAIVEPVEVAEALVLSGHGEWRTY